MRYAVSATNLPAAEVEAKCRQVGARNIVVAPLTRQVFCDIEEEQAARLRAMGLRTSPVGRVVSTVPVAPVDDPVVWALALNVGEQLHPLRATFSPALTGTGLTVAVLDSGVRKTHRELAGKVVYEANFSTAPTADDLFGHGTHNSSIIAGNTVGVAPGAALMNIKVINDEGDGTEEEVVSGVEEVCQLVNEAKAKGLHPTSPDYPNVINLSLGAPDYPADPDTPMKVAARVAIREYGLEVVSSAGNDGPERSTITSPASEPLVIAVGGIYSEKFELWERSSRGPTLLGAVKPDFVCWATGIVGAGAGADDAYQAGTGTSFAAPILSGARGLLDEAARRGYGPDYILPWSAVESFATTVCAKVEGAPPGKDNDWGYGFPMFAAIVGRAKLIVDISPLLALPVLGLVGMMLTTTAREVVRR